MKFHTQFRPGDLVRDKKTGNEGIIIAAQSMWCDERPDRSQGTIFRECSELKRRHEVYQGGHYGLYPKARNSLLKGYWYKDDELELVKKGFLH